LVTGGKPYTYQKELEKTVTQAKKGVAWEFEKLEYFKLIGIEEDKSDIIKNAYISNGNGSIIKPFQVNVFKVDFAALFIYAFG
jgi:hypothetical protein